MKTRKAIEDERKPKRSKKMQGLIPFHLYDSFSDLIGVIEAKLVDEMEKPKPNWSRGAKEVIQHIVWSYTNSNVDASEDRKKEGTYENSLLCLSLCDKKVIKEKVGFPITPGTLHPWLEVKESAIEGAGLGLFAAKRFEPREIITIYFAPTKGKKPPKFTKYAILRSGYYFSVREGLSYNAINVYCFRKA